MARTKGASGRRRLGAVRVKNDSTLVPINSERAQALLANRPLLPLARKGLDRSLLQRIRDGRQASMRFGPLKLLAELLVVPVGELLVASGPGETCDTYRIDVTARAVAQECWQAGGQRGECPLWLDGLVRSLLSYDLWAGAFLAGGIPAIRIDPERGGRMRGRAMECRETKRRQFCDHMAAAIRVLLPTDADQGHGVRVNPWRAGALLQALQSGYVTRVQAVGTPSTAAVRRLVEEEVDRLLSAMHDPQPPH